MIFQVNLEQFRNLLSQFENPFSLDSKELIFETHSTKFQVQFFINTRITSLAQFHRPLMQIQVNFRFPVLPDPEKLRQNLILFIQTIRWLSFFKSEINLIFFSKETIFFKGDGFFLINLNFLFSIIGRDRFLNCH